MTPPEEVRRQLEKLRTLERVVDSVGDGLVITQGDQVVFHNATFERMVSYSAAEFTTVSFAEFIHPDDRIEVMERYREVLDEGAAVFDVEFRAVTKTKDVRWFRVSAQPVAWRGHPAVLNAFTDITGEKVTGTALRTSEAKFEYLLDAVPAGVFEMDLGSGKMLRVNDHACEVLGYSRDELMPLGPMSLLTDESKAIAVERIQAVARGEQVSATVEYDMVTKDGRVLPGLFNTRQTHHDDGSVTSCVVVQDLTEVKRREQQTNRIEKLEALGILAGGIAHDFNNLLTVILSGISSVRFDLTPESPTGAALADVEKACLRARGLTHQLLTFSTGGAPIRRAVATGDLLREHTEFALRGSNIGCEIDVDETKWPVAIDENQINQVITNIVINASQAMPEGGVIEVGAANREVADSEAPVEPGRYVEIWFRDSGTGMSPEHLARAFDPYFTTKQTGSGLGLATAYSIVSRHGGQLTLESDLGRGTTARLLLPASEETLKPAATAVLQTGSGRVLLMDDEVLVRDAGQRLLAALGYETVAVADGAAAIAAYREQLEAGTPFDLVLMDLTVRAGMGGVEAWAAIRALDGCARGVVSSGYSNDPVMSRPAEFGFQGVIAKPFTIEDLAEEVARVLKA